MLLDELALVVTTKNIHDTVAIDAPSTLPEDEPTLRVPMSITWPGRVRPQSIDAVASNLDLAPTIAGLLGLEYPSDFRGYDWTDVLYGGVAPLDRITRHQAHRGAVISRHDSDLARRAGLLEVGVVREGSKEIISPAERSRWKFDLRADPKELENLVLSVSDPTMNLQSWMEVVDTGLGRSDAEVQQPLDDDTIEQLRALGYAD